MHGSVAVELDWVLSSAHRLGKRPLRAVVEELYASDPEMVAQVTSLWGPDEALSYPGYLELSVLANHGGLIFSTDSDDLLASLEALCRDAPVDLPLESETPDDRERILRRLRILRTSAKRRRRYLDVVSRVWSAVRPAWEAEGRAAVQAEVSARRAALEREPTWQEFAADDCHCQNVSLDDLVRDLGPDGELAVVPTWFNQKGLVFDLPGVVVVGVGTDPSDVETKLRSERVARRLKAIADPTRLAILAGLARNEMTVSDVARRFALAQPTVSNHVKLLRDAGFVTIRNAGRNRMLLVQRDVLAELERDLQDLMGVPAV